MPDVFISHSTDTRDEAQSLAAALRAHGLNTWIDLEHLQPGDDWIREIDEEIHRAQYFVVLVGPGSEHSESLRNEWSRILQEVWAGKGKRVFPLLVRDAALPPFLSEWQYLRPEGDWNQVAEELAHAIQGSSTVLEGAPPEAEIYRRQALERIRRLKSEVADSPSLQADGTR